MLTVDDFPIEEEGAFLSLSLFVALISQTDQLFEGIVAFATVAGFSEGLHQSVAGSDIDIVVIDPFLFQL